MMPIDGSALDRDKQLARATTEASWDIVLIGGGATGAGIAMDAASRGLSVLLLESHDYGKGTSSRSTKLIHGGVRYLEQFQIHMVRESLRERGRLLVNAPEIVHELRFIIPCQNWFQRLFYGAGLKVYDFLAIGSKAERSKQVSKSFLYQLMPRLACGKFSGGVSYSDAQFDDTRLLIETVRIAAEHGACCLNYASVTQLQKDDSGRVNGVVFIDQETGTTHSVKGKAIINATGPFCDSIRKLDKPNAESLLAASQGVHLVLPKSFFPSEHALIVPKTSDGRVLFIIPWHEHVLVGTTDTALQEVSFEPVPFESEMQFLLNTTEEYCGRRPAVHECLSVFTGIRPLVRASKAQSTKKLSRDHTIEVSESGLMTITGGKWTTYRQMAEDCVNQILSHYDLRSESCKTASMRIEPSPHLEERSIAPNPGHWPLGPESTLVNLIHYSDLKHAVEYEQARTVEDLLARRTRALFLNAREALQLAPIAAELLASQLGRDSEWIAAELSKFEELARKYLPTTYLT